MLTAEQKKMARHALGLPNNHRTSYRNHYALTRSENPGPAYRAWTALVDAGLATVEAGGSLDFFHLTHAGAQLALEKRERLDREDFPAPAAAEKGER